MSKNNNSNGLNASEVRQQHIKDDINQKSQNNRSGNGVNIIGQHNYSYDAKQPNQKGLVAKLRRWCRPVIKFYRILHYKLEDSAKKRKKLFILTSFCILIGACTWGAFDKMQMVVKNTPVNASRTFVNQDSIKMARKAYDKKNHTLQMDFVTSSPSGTVSPSNLSANFVLAKAPSGARKVVRPTMNLIPSFNNHFTVIVHHLYHNFGGLELSFHNNSNMTVDTLQNILENSSGGLDQYLSKSERNEANRVAENGGSATDAKDIQRILDKLKNKDNSNFIVGERNLNNYSANIDASASPRDLALGDLNKHLKKDYSDIQGDKDFIKSENNQLKGEQDKIRQINRGADTGDKKNELQAVKHEAQSLRSHIDGYKSDISKKKQDITTTLSRISRVKNNISILPKTKAPQAGKVFSSSAH